MAQISASPVSRWIHEGKLVLHFLFDFLILKRSILVGHGRWQRNRTGRPLSPLQIHRKNIWTLSKLHKTTDREQKDIITQVQESQRVPNRINPRRNTPRHILIKLTKIKHKEIDTLKSLWPESLASDGLGASKEDGVQETWEPWHEVSDECPWHSRQSTDLEGWGAL